MHYKTFSSMIVFVFVNSCCMASEQKNNNPLAEQQQLIEQNAEQKELARLDDQYAHDLKNTKQCIRRSKCVLLCMGVGLFTACTIGVNSLILYQRKYHCPNDF